MNGDESIRKSTLQLLYNFLLIIRNIMMDGSSGLSSTPGPLIIKFTLLFFIHGPMKTITNY